MESFKGARLDAYSQIAAPLILKEYPEWIDHAEIKSDDGSRASFVEFNVASPSSAVESGLWVSTQNQELTVGFHTHHCHFTDYDEGTHTQQIRHGLEFASGIISERLGIVSYYHGDRFVGSSFVELPHPDPLRSRREHGGFFAKLVKPSSQVTLRSWLGRFDRNE